MQRPEITCDRDCTDRKGGCHATCEKYAKYRADLEAFNAELYRKKNQEKLANDVEYEGFERRAKKRR